MFLDGEKKIILFPSVETNTIGRGERTSTIHPLIGTELNISDHSAPNASVRGSTEQTFTDFLRFLFSNFRYSLTLFSKFFASFPHGTCTLSVSHQYLAFDGIYHPLRAAIPNNSTQLCSLTATVKREYHPLCCPVPRDFDHHKWCKHTTILRFEHFPLQSPLLRESWLVSFPPLNYMLKFGG